MIQLSVDELTCILNRLIELTQRERLCWVGDHVRDTMATRIGDKYSYEVSVVRTTTPVSFIFTIRECAEQTVLYSRMSVSRGAYAQAAERMQRLYALASASFAESYKNRLSEAISALNDL